MLDFETHIVFPNRAFSTYSGQEVTVAKKAFNLYKHIIMTHLYSIVGTLDCKLAWCYLQTLTMPNRWLYTTPSMQQIANPQSPYFTLIHAPLHTWLLLATRIACMTHVAFVYVAMCPVAHLNLCAHPQRADFWYTLLRFIKGIKLQWNICYIAKTTCKEVLHLPG